MNFKTYTKVAIIFDIIYIIVVSLSTTTLGIGLFLDNEYLVYQAIGLAGCYIGIYQLHSTIVIVHCNTGNKFPILYSRICVVLGFKTFIPMIILGVLYLPLRNQDYILNLLLMMLPITIITCLMNYPLAVIKFTEPGFDILYKDMSPSKEWREQRWPWDNRDI